MMHVLIGTTNPSKRKLFANVLAGYPVELMTLDDLGIADEPDEMGGTPAENAAIKAAFYGRYADYVICGDSGLYFDGIPLDDPRQPGLHIRTPYGKRLNDDEMIEHYSSLVHSLGGRVTAFYLDAFAVKTPHGMHTYMKTPEEARDSAFWMLDRAVEKRRPGWPLDSLSMEMDETSFMDESAELKPSTSGETKRAWMQFFVTALGLNPLEDA